MPSTVVGAPQLYHMHVYGKYEPRDRIHKAVYYLCTRPAHHKMAKDGSVYGVVSSFMDYQLMCT